ncbi:MAG: hypothetical protein KatS3mg123_2371 [Burkholderiales bacterium]|nr:MAG: hypothetical protein KatS3mg123_2371 [Burkholderiales bacterium]
MKKIRYFIGPLVACLAGTGAALAQGPFPTTAADIHASPTPGQLVELRGRVVERLRDNEFRFDDGTGHLVLDAGPPWWHTVSLPAGAEVTVVGRVSLGPPHARQALEPEIDVHRLQTPAGEMIRVRDVGPAPWAGGLPLAAVLKR